MVASHVAQLYADTGSEIRCVYDTITKLAKALGGFPVRGMVMPVCIGALWVFSTDAVVVELKRTDEYNALLELAAGIVSEGMGTNISGHRLSSVEPHITIARLYTI